MLTLTASNIATGELSKVEKNGKREAKIHDKKPLVPYA